MNSIKGCAASLPCALLFLALGCSGCFETHIGMWNESAYKSVDYGAPRTVHVCVYLDNGVSQDDAVALMKTTIDEDRHLYNLNVVPEGFETLPRSGFYHDEILKTVSGIPLSGNCDRVFYFAHHNAADYVYANAPLLVAGVTLPEVFGEVDDATMTHGFAYAENDGLNSLVAGGPSKITWHEFYHLLGSCPHAWSMNECYQRLGALKQTAAENDSDFYPSMSEDGRHIFITRDQVNLVLGDQTNEAVKVASGGQ